MGLTAVVIPDVERKPWRIVKGRVLATDK